jgi:hypothetical protein
MHMREREYIGVLQVSHRIILGVKTNLWGEKLFMSTFAIDATEVTLLKEKYGKEGFFVQDHFLSLHECQRLLQCVDQCNKNHPLEEIQRKTGGRSLHYFVIDGEKVEKYLEDIFQLYKDLSSFVSEICDEEMVPLANKKASININITPRGGEYRWHYDRNAATVLLYLNEVSGGEIECYPKYRLYLGGKTPTFLQRWIDMFQSLSIVRRIFGKKVVVKPYPGRLVLMQGHTCLHSVRSVTSDQQRINIVAAYDKPDTSFPFDKDLDTYLYTREAVSSDPNYTYKKSVEPQ